MKNRQAAIGDLVYLSGNEIGKSKKKAAKKEKRKEKKPAKKAARKDKVKRVFKKVAKVALVPSRAAFLTVVSLNLLKMATKLVRVYNTPSGKAELQKFWEGFGGKMDALKKAMSKGSKTQVAYVGVAAEAVIASALPIIVVAVKLVKQFKAGGDDKEQKDFNNDLAAGYKELSSNPDYEKTGVQMPEGENAAEVKAAGSESTDGGFLSDMSTPVKIGLGLGAAGLLYMAVKPTK